MRLLKCKLLRNPCRYVHTIIKHECSKWVAPSGEKTEILIHNCIVGKKVPLILRNKDYITWYTCGPTVYDSAHLGHASCYIKLDIIQRILQQYFLYNIVTVINITDIDDKIIKRSRDANIEPSDLATKYENEFWRDMRALGVQQPNIICRVTEHIPQIINFIKTLVDNGNAYVTETGTVYFNLENYKYYNKLVTSTQSSQWTDHVDVHKRRSDDFAVWKAAKEGEPFWDSFWGPGRPGWHIECSAMASEILGNKIDVHAGGIDLKFPHHENEEAQSCAFHNSTQWVNYWIHTGHLSANSSEKMSKSLSNTITIQEFLNAYSSQELRMACLMSHYRSHMKYSADLMKTSKALLSKFYSFFEYCDQFITGNYVCSDANKIHLQQMLQNTNVSIRTALTDDFDTSSVINSLLELVAFTNTAMNEKLKKHTQHIYTNLDIILIVRNLISRILQVFGIDIESRLEKGSEIREFVGILDSVTIFRQGVRQIAIANKQKELLKLCDNFRADLSVQGIEFKDQKINSSWSSVKNVVKTQ